MDNRDSKETQSEFEKFEDFAKDSSSSESRGGRKRERISERTKESKTKIAAQEKTRQGTLTIEQPLH